ncbi:MAG TPA: cysteine synthase A [Candidatus Eisenbacteria bacterium]|nr:cysteine synthase A [Candidatus Eisenbacteria bacterium]
MASKQPPLKLDGPLRKRVYDSIAETIGNTPLVRLNRVAQEAGAVARVLVKLEYLNPLLSVKDRIGVSMIEALEAEGTIGPGSVIIEPTSGNTGIGLAFMCAVRGYRCILTMPESMSIERRKMFALLGAETVLTPKEQRVQGAVDAAQKLLKEIPNSVMPWQFGNPANPAIHRRTTAEEIWSDTGGEVDFLVSGVGTGGTLTGCGEVLRPRRPSLKIVAVEPRDSAVLSGGTAGPHAIQGIGAGFVPEVLDVKLIDEIIKITNEDAVATARKVARQEGIPVGISSGAIISAALQVAARKENQGKTVVCFAPSNAERYMSTVLFEGL